jgi:2-C-methyl-D-erythritol 2,4-cyclodiphosphate synthase
MVHTEPRIGHGYDLHRLEPQAPEGAGKPLVIGGVGIDHDRGPVGHSDGDAVLHAITDALLGAIGAPDIGELFPDTDPRFLDMDSSAFLLEAMKRVEAAGMTIANLDVTVVCERPKISPHKNAICDRIAELLDIGRAQVNIKGKTHESVDALGEGRAIESHAIVLLKPSA